jgi:Asp-tRNA(Asn)/Glu-tRNA(Gln) amidotransferase A subunit family amidase
MTSAPNTLDASALAARLERRELTAEALLRACLERIDAREAQVKAFVHIDREGALAAARALDAGAWRGPLHGLPVAIKDVFDTRGLPTRYGSPIHADHVPQQDAAVVALSREAGGVLMGKAVTTEFATYHPGPTRNPHDLGCTPGGSSSGSAAAVADAMVPLATGTQTAGSVIRPAAFCGVVGFKPTWGRISRTGLKMLSESLDTVGLFGRSVPDVGLFASVLTSDAALRVPLAGVATRSLRVGLFEGPDDGLLDADVRALIERVRGRLDGVVRSASAVQAPEWFAGLGAQQTAVMQFEMARSLSDERIRHPELLSPRLAAMIAAGLQVDGSAHAANLARWQGARQRVDTLFEDHDLLIAPSAIGEAPALEQGTGDPVFCRSWTLLGLPCLHLPLGTGARGLPIGLQLIAPAYQDVMLLQAGAWLHARLRD